MDFRLPFSKMHGAGNDFIMVAATDCPPRGLSAARIAALCHRRTGIGADGLIVVAEDREADFRMIYFNADGGKAEMCGNGARCAAAFARRLGLVQECCRFATVAGMVDGWLDDDGVRVALPPWRDLRLNQELAGSPFTSQHYVNTGVPHLVVPVDDVEEVDVPRWGRPLRSHAGLGAGGANVDWVDAAQVGGRFKLRTYERGVEAETLACGTGAVAAAVVLCELGLAASPVRLHTRGGDLLTVTVGDGHDQHAVSLHGPAVVAYTGEVEINE